MPARAARCGLLLALWCRYTLPGSAMHSLAVLAHSVLQADCGLAAALPDPLAFSTVGCCRHIQSFATTRAAGRRTGYANLGLVSGGVVVWPPPRALGKLLTQPPVSLRRFHLAAVQQAYAPLHSGSEAAPGTRYAGMPAQGPSPGTRSLLGEPGSMPASCAVPCRSSVDSSSDEGADSDSSLGPGGSSPPETGAGHGTGTGDADLLQLASEVEGGGMPVRRCGPRRVAGYMRGRHARMADDSDSGSEGSSDSGSDGREASRSTSSSRSSLDGSNGCGGGGGLRDAEASLPSSKLPLPPLDGPDCLEIGSDFLLGGSDFFDLDSKDSDLDLGCSSPQLTAGRVTVGVLERAPVCTAPVAPSALSFRLAAS